MKYIYTKPMCSACFELKHSLDSEGIEYIERDADRLKNPADDVDDIDKSAFVILCDQGMILPVEVECDEDT